MNIAMITQARLGSTRLPKKVLKFLPYDSNITVLEQDIRRMKKSKLINEIIVATTKNVEDNSIVEIAKKENVKYFRGSEDDVLNRYYFAAKENNVDIVVRVTSDCPCIDGDIIDMVVAEFLKDITYDFVATVLKRTFPIGLDVEVIKFSALERAYKEAKKDYQREHVSDYIYENPHKFKLKNVEASDKYNNAKLRITLDTKEDYMLLCAIYDYLYYNDNYFSAADVVKILSEKPWLTFINNNSMQKKDDCNLEEEINDAAKFLQLQGMKRARDILLNRFGKGV